MFSHPPFTLHGRSPLHVLPALPLWKRALDLGCCVVGIPLLGFVTFLASMVTVITSGGPVIFRQEKMSASGRRFGIYRFRTMRVSSAHDGTSRMIPAGGLLRASGLADLPQILNVLRGEMSIVGPRPDAFSASANLAGAVESRRHAVPGLTGMWRLRVDEDGTNDQVRRWEQTYAEKQSFVGDLGILVRSFWAALSLQMRA